MIPPVPVFDLEQNDNGVIFAGTHGRGAFALMAAAVTPTPTATATATATVTPTATSTPTEVPEPLNHKPGSVNFGRVSVGHPRVKAVTLSNPAKTGPQITFGNPFATVPATSPQEFGFPANATNCPAKLFPKKKCKLMLEFSPATSGPKSSAVTIFDNAGNANQVIPLQGIGK